MENDTTHPARRIFDAALAAVQPEVFMPQHLQADAQGLIICGRHYSFTRYSNIRLLGAGKAAAAMAAAAEAIIGGRLGEGLVVTKHGHGQPLRYTRLVEAGHPVPDAGGVAGAAALAAQLEAGSEGDLLILLLSGGASALLADGADGISLEDLQHTSSLLLRGGADITALNTVRKHLSRLKGGGAARLAQPATLVTLVLSDVVGDPLDVIASGPSVPDPSTFAEAAGVLKSYGLWEALRPSVRHHIEAGLCGMQPDTPKPGHPLFAHCPTHLVATNRTALEAAAHAAAGLGYTPRILTDRLTGDAVQEITALLHALPAYRQEVPVCLLLGGETTVQVKGQGRGGRAQHAALTALDFWRRHPDLPLQAILAGGTDGTDGPTDAAGAIVDTAVLRRAGALGLDPRPYLANSDAYTFFEQSGGLLMTGPTGTNVMDLLILLVPPLQKEG